MAQIPYRANLSAATFPMSLEKAGRTVIFAAQDQNFDRRVDPPGDTSKDAGIPQLIYCENVLPTYNGYQSLGWIPHQAITLPNNEYLIHELETPVASANGITPWCLRLTSDDLAYAGIGPNGGNALVAMPGGYVCPLQEGSVTIQFVQGRTFLFLPGLLYEITEVLGALIVTDVSGTVTGITLANVQCMTTAFNYHIVCNIDGSVQWSSLVSPVDWTASLVTGASGETPSQLSDSVVLALCHPQGFIIYTRSKAIAAQYTGNKGYPFRFYEIESSGGITFPNYVSGSTNSSTHFCRTNLGIFQLVTMQGAETILEDVSDYFQTSRTITEFDPVTSTFTTGRYNANAADLVLGVLGVANKVTVLDDRYVAVSYGVSLVAPGTGSDSHVYDYAIIYDRMLRRMGKIKRTHSHLSAFRGVIFASAGYPTNLKADGELVYQLFTDLYEDNSDATPPPAYRHEGVIALGKFQYVRDRFLSLEAIEIEGIQDFAVFPVPNFKIVDCLTLDGKTYGITAALLKNPVKTSHVGTLVKYNIHAEAKNHTIVLSGAFDLSSFELSFVVGGK